MTAAWLLLLGANLVYHVVRRYRRCCATCLRDAGLVRLLLGPWCGAVHQAGAAGPPLGRAEAWSVRWMGILGFGAAFALGNWGLERSTATNAALLITLEPTALMLLGPLLLGERLSRREALGGALTVVGAALVVSDGVPGLGGGLFPHWRGTRCSYSALAYSTTRSREGVLVRHPRCPSPQVAARASAARPARRRPGSGGQRPRGQGR
jgi:hypothetical protein